MHSYTSVPVLMFATLGVALLIAVILLLRFRSREPHHPMEHQRERNIEEIRQGVPPQQE